MASFENSQSWLPKRQRADSGDGAQSLQYDDYTVGWISALPLEMTAAQAMLDHAHEPLRQHPQDSNCYEFGSINGHNVVIACLPKAQYGNNNAAIVANNMNRTFPHLQHRLLVGIAGGAPGAVDVRLGDVVVSTDAIQYDLGKALPNNHFQRIAKAISPPQALLTVVSKLEASHIGGQNRMLEILVESVARLPHYSHPMVEDRLFHHECPHTSSSSDCDGCDISQLIVRTVRQHTQPVIHYGRVASGNQVIKDALTREKLSKEITNICFEMEAAGVMDNFPCLVIRGICDYSDSHKNKGWQEYAALVASAYAKELLMSMPPTLMQSWKRVRIQQPKDSEPFNTEADECLQEMFVTDSSLDRESILDAKGDICEGTCEWILTTDKFQRWDQNPPHLLWISAPPGMGKTFMSIYLSKHLEAISKKGSGVATIFFFCDNKDESRNTAVGILRGLMYQLISHQPSLINTIIPQWKQQKQRLFQETSFVSLWKLFEDIIAKSEYKTIYCVIDALDECEAKSLSLLLRKLERLSQGRLDSSPKLRLICLSKRYPENIPEALLLFTKMKLDTMVARKEDIDQFISFKVQGLAQKKGLSSEMWSSLKDTFQRKSEGTFLWASLEMLPGGLEAVYDRILQNIDFEKRGTVRSILYWILVAMSPLTISQLCEAVDIGPRGFLTRENVCMELVKSCGHLLQIRNKRRRSYKKQTVTFLHQSAKDYLMESNYMLDLQISRFALSQLHEHATIGLIRYLERISGHPGIESKTLDDVAKDFPMAIYAVERWHHHFKTLEDIAQVMQQGAGFFKGDSKARQVWQHLQDFHDDYENPSPMPLLHLSAYLSLGRLTEWCLRNEGELDLDAEWGFSKRTALAIACEEQEEQIITLLLDAGADAIAVRRGNTNALQVALSCCERHILHILARSESCRRFLLGQASKGDPSLIKAAACNEHACRFLIEDLGWDLNWQNGRLGQLALSTALKRCRISIVGCLVKEWNVPIEDHSDKLKEMCSFGAVEDEFEKCLRFLVHHCFLNVNATDKEGHNALCALLTGLVHAVT
ncbi:heterokaryon incompatibility protein het-E-1 [Fusarium pseudocircinatum]|uniref:Heterokaryon incompatibility protein het-E-1 n=1 Tax=Fusarium pseudocircinatum TaxID=56676 RepID=A0A8H5PZM0_9HYPO|nr:heterokaryon incompatibility protein het-E-1 [Fusarium pseudocircinatum]